MAPDPPYAAAVVFVATAASIVGLGLAVLHFLL